MRIDRGLALLAALSITSSAAAQDAAEATPPAEAPAAEAPKASEDPQAASAALTPEQREKLKDELREELKAELLGELSAANPQGPVVDDSWAEEEFKWEEPVEPELNFVEFDGYFRFRYQYFYNLDLNTYYNNSVTQVVYGPFVTSQISAPTAACNTDSGTGGCLEGEGRSGTLGTNNMRLRLEPVFNVYEDVKIKMQIDVFDNLVLGSTPDVFPGNAYTPLSVLSDTQLSPTSGLNSVSDSIKVKRVWTEIGTPLGQLRIGRMPSNFGMGLAFNDGAGIDADYGDNVDRVAFATEIGGFTVIPAIEYSATGVTSSSSETITGQAFDREQRDDANQWMLTILHTVSEEEAKRRLSAGELVLNYGTVQAARFQSLDSAAFYSGDSVDDQASTSSLTKRDASLYRYSYWMKLMWGHLSVEAEYAGVLGKIGNPTTGTSATYASEDAVNFSNGITLNQHGAAVNVEYHLLDDALTLGFLFVVASGDDSPGWGRMPLYGVSSGRASAGAWDGAQAGCTNIEVDSSGNQTCTGTRDRTLGNFQVDQAFVVDLILWRQLVGGVTDAMVFRPSIMYQGDSGFGIRFDAVFSRALFAASTPSGSFSAVDQDLGSSSNNLGLELDLKLFYDAAHGGLHTWLQYGMLIPFSGMDRLVEVDSSRSDSFEGSTEVVSQTTYGRMDASLAHTLQLLVGVSFLWRSERLSSFVGRILRALARTLQTGNASRADSAGPFHLCVRLPSIISISIIFIAACGGGEESTAEPDRVLSDRLISAERETVVSAPALSSGDFKLSDTLSSLFTRLAGVSDWAPASERAELLLPLAEAALDAPLTAPGRARSLASQPETASEAIRAAAAQLGAGSDSRLVYQTEDFEDVKDAICDSYGCEEAEGELSASWQAALSPILRAALGVMEARAARSQALSRRSADWWTTRGAYGLIPSDGAGYSVTNSEDRAYIGGDRAALYEAAAALAEAIEGTRWPSDEGEYRLKTGAGWIILGGRGDDRYEASLGATLLLVDMGGDDLYLAPVAANQSGDNAVSLLVDLGGNDRYSYPEAEAWKGGQLPADADGRKDFSAQQQGVSASTAARQGAGRNGVALLYDLGEGSDRYEALRMSQGYAHQGVGVLFDEGGDDRYTGEAAVQGAAQFGIGLLIDRAGQDSYTAEHAAQGFGYVAGFGALFDRSGDDAYTCDPGVDGGAHYRSAQHPEDGASSFCQGAGFGLRVDKGLAGGIGLLSDEAGDDSYIAGVFAQGSGYYNGLGVLVDSDGSDSYDAIHYAQGGAAHHAAGWLLDFGGDDSYNTARWGKAYNLGAGWDRSVGVAYDGGGDDTYVVPPTSGGMGGAGAFGALLDAAGSDDYQARFISNLGFGQEVKGYVGVGLFLDGAGQDAYLMDRADDSAWTGGESDTGAGEDRETEVFTNAGV